MIQSYGSAVSNVSGALKNLFEKNKAFAYADASVKAYLAFNQALTNPPGPPWSYANAAAALANGLAQVRAIKSTNFGSLGGAAGGSASSSSAASAAPAAGPSTTLYISGINEGHLYSGDRMRELFAQINEHLRNGGRLQLA
jgi:hypothetical protein